MSGLAIEFLDQSLHRVIFDAMPMPVFVVDADVFILEYNSAAAALIGSNRATVLRRRGGEVLQCVNASEHPAGCGHSKHCLDCVIRNSVRSAAKGTAVTQQPTRLELIASGKRSMIDVRVSTRPFAYDKHSFVLLIMEGLEKLAASPQRAPACKAGL